MSRNKLKIDRRKKYGKLKIVKFVGMDKRGQVVRCKCDCGGSIEVPFVALVHGNNSSCGCIYKPDLTGKKFGKLIVTKKHADRFIHKYSSEQQWLCTCECGETRIISTGGLNSGHHNSCGCDAHKKQKSHRQWKGVGDLGKSHVNSIEFNAKKRNLEFKVTATQLWNLFQRQKGKCALSGIPLQFGKSKQQTASLDRINSKKGYTLNNVQWVHKHINRMKWILTDKEFIDWCAKVTDYQKKKKNVHI